MHGAEFWSVPNAAHVGSTDSFAQEIPTRVFWKNYLAVRHFPAQVPWLIQKGPWQSTFPTRVAWYKPTYNVMGPVTTNCAVCSTVHLTSIYYQVPGN